MLQSQTGQSPSAGLGCHDPTPVTLTSLHSEARLPGILIVDDDAGIRAMLEYGFRRFGFNVWPAANGRAAVDCYRANRESIDAVLLDVLMPGRDGPETLADLQAVNPRIRACFMTGESGHFTEQNLFDLGAHAVFWKPIHLLEVIEHLRALAVTIPESTNLVGDLLPAKQGDR